MLTNLIIFVLAGAGSATAPPPVAIAAPAPRASRASSEASDREAFEQGLRSSAGGPVLAAIERHFPQDGEALVDRLYETARANRNNLTAILQQATAEMERYIQSKTPLIVNAPADALVALNERSLGVFRTMLERDPALCGRMIVGGGDLSPRDLIRMSSEEVMEISIGLIETAAMGSRGPAIGGRGQLNEDEAVAWILEIEALDPAGDLRSLIEDPAKLARAPAERQCRVGILIHESIGRLEPEAAANVYAYILSEGAREQAAERP